MFPANLQAVLNPDRSISITWEDSDQSQDTNESPQIVSKTGPDFVDNTLLPPGTLAYTFAPVPAHRKYSITVTSLWGNAQQGLGKSATAGPITIDVKK